MSTPPVQVAITAADLTGPAFASAGAKAQAFEQSTNGSMASSMRAARLLNSELDLGMNRTLVSILGKSQLLGSALSVAFPVVAAVGFATAAWEVYKALSGAEEEAKKLEERQSLADSFRKVAEEVAKIQAGMRDIGKSSQQVALNAFQEAQFALVSLQARVSMQRELARNLEATGKAHSGFAFDVPGATGPRQTDIHAGDLAFAGALRGNADRLATDLALLQAKLDQAAAKMGQAFVDAGEKSAKSLEHLKKAFEDVVDAVDKASRKYKTQPQTLAGLMPLGEPGKGYYDVGQWGTPSSPLYSGSKSAMDLAKIQTDQNAAIQAAQQIYEQTKTKAQEYSDTIAVLTELLNQSRISQEQFSIAATQAGQKLNDNNKAWRQFGEEVGRNIEQAALFGRSWSDALKAIMVDVAKLIIQMTILKKLEEKYGEGGSEGGAGGFFTALVGGFSGKHASGGTIPAGMYGLVGENGPELAYGGTSGLNITPNGKFGGQTINYIIDAKGDLAQEQRIMRAIKMAHDSAVRQSVVATQERMART